MSSLTSCSICSHPRRFEIESALVTGQTYREVSDRFGMSHTTVGRHKQHWTPTEFVQGEAAPIAFDLKGSLIKLLGYMTQSVEDARRYVAKLPKDSEDRLAALNILNQMTTRTVDRLNSTAAMGIIAAAIKDEKAAPREVVFKIMVADPEGGEREIEWPAPDQR